MPNFITSNCSSFNFSIKCNRNPISPSIFFIWFLRNNSSSSSQFHFLSCPISLQSSTVSPSTQLNKSLSIPQQHLVVSLPNQQTHKECINSPKQAIKNSCINNYPNNKIHRDFNFGVAH